MGRIDLVVAIGANQQEVLHIELRHQILDQIEGSRVEPLQVIEKKRQRVFGPRKDADKAAEYKLETPLRRSRRKLGQRWLLADDDLQFRDEIHDELSIGPQRLKQYLAPLTQFGFALAEKLPDQALKGLCESRVWNVAFKLIELAGGEKPARQHQYRLQFVDHRGLADAEIAGDQDQFRGSSADDPIEGSEQGVDLALPPIKLLRDQEPAGRIVFAEWKIINPALRVPFGLAVAKVGFETSGGLIAIFGSLREQFHDDRRNCTRNFLQPLGRRHRPPGEMAVHPFHRVRGGEGQSTREHPVEGDAERVEVAPGID